MSDVPLLPGFTGDPNSRRDIIDYIVNPANAGLLDLDAKIDAITALLGDKVAHYVQESAPSSASIGDMWTRPSTGSSKYCHTTYTIAEPSPSTQWNSFKNAEAQATLETIAQLASPTPQVTLLQSTLTGIVADESVTSSEKTTVKLVYDELVARKSEIDIAATRYTLTGTLNYTDYVASYATWKSYIDTTLNLFGDMGSDTAVSPNTTWINNWNAVLSDEADILNDIRSAAQDVIDTISGDLSAVEAQIDEMAADGTISPTEKLRFRDEWERIQDEFNELNSQATLYSLTGDTQWTELSSAYTALQTYLGAGETNVFGDYLTATVLTSVGSNATEWLQKWQAYWLSARVFDNHVDAYFKGLIDTQQSALDAIVTSVQSLSDDNVISGGTEKELLLDKWNQIIRLNANILYQGAKYSVSTPASYTTAYNNLDTYLNTTIGVFDNMSSDTNVVRSTFNQFFSLYEAQYDSFSNLVVDAQKNAVDADPADYENYKALINSVIDDGIVSAGMEKTRFNALWLDIQSTHAVIKAKADNVGVNTVGFQAAYDDLSAYIGTLTAPGGGSPNFTIEGEDTAIGVSTWHAKIRTYEQTKSTLESDVINSIVTLQQDTARSILDINDDGIVSPPEKATVKREFDRLTSLKAQMETQADLLSITTEKTNMTTAYNTLDTFLDSLDGGLGLFNDMGSATVLTSPEQANWDTNWNSLYSTIAILETTIVSTIVGNTSAVASAAFQKNGSVIATGDFNLGGFKVQNLGETTPASGVKDAATVGQLYTEQQARGAHEADTSAHGATGGVVGATKAQTLTNKTIDVDLNTVSNVETDNLKAGVVVTNKDFLTGVTLRRLVVSAPTGTTPVADDAITSSGTGVGEVSEVITATEFIIRVTSGAFNVAETVTSGGWSATIDTSTAETAKTNTNLPGAQSVKEAIQYHNDNLKHGVTGDVVGTSDVQTLTNKTINGPDNTITNLDGTNFGTNLVTNLTAGTFTNDEIAGALAIKQAIDAGGGGGGGAAIEGVSEIYSVGINAIDSGAKTSFSSALIGTRIDVTDGAYSASSFRFDISGHINVDNSVSTAYMSYPVKGFIEKSSGGNPYVFLTIYNGYASGYHEGEASTLSGALATTSSTQSVNPSNTTITGVEVERVDSVNELCFRININTGATRTDTDFKLHMSGIRTYTGTDTGTAGTIIQQTPLVVGGNAVGEDYGVRATASTTTTTAHSVGPVGTRLDITDPNYSDSSFTLKGEAIFEESTNRSCKVGITIKKQSGGDPYAILTPAMLDEIGDNIGPDLQRYGGSTLTVGSPTLTVTMAPTSAGGWVQDVQITRSAPSNELAFTLTCNSHASQSLTANVYLTGPKSYSGVDVGSSGTTF